MPDRSTVINTIKNQFGEPIACLLYDAFREIMNEVKKDDLDRVIFRNEQFRKYFPKSYTIQQMKGSPISL